MMQAIQNQNQKLVNHEKFFISCLQKQQGKISGKTLTGIRKLF